MADGNITEKQLVIWNQLKKSFAAVAPSTDEEGNNRPGRKGVRLSDLLNVNIDENDEPLFVSAKQAGIVIAKAIAMSRVRKATTRPTVVFATKTTAAVEAEASPVAQAPAEAVAPAAKAPRAKRKQEATA